MKEFQVNDYLTLKLERNETVIYVAGERFRQCKYLFLKITIDKIASFDNIKSIDEAAELLNKSLESELGNKSNEIPPRVEFWGHCSNLQVWYENNYDTRLLHSNLAFPLLKKLTEIGDPLAKKLFKEEIAKRFGSHYPSLVVYLIKEGYLKYFNPEEIKTLFTSFDYDILSNNIKNKKELFSILRNLADIVGRGAKEAFEKEIVRLLEEKYNDEIIDFAQSTGEKYIQREKFFRALLKPKEARAMIKLENITGVKYAVLPKILDPIPAIQIKDRIIVDLSITDCDLEEFPSIIINFKNLKTLCIQKEIADKIGINLIKKFIKNFNNLTDFIVS